MPVRLIRVERGTEPAVNVQMNMGAIFAGAFLTIGFGTLFLLLGNAVGLSPSNTVNAGATGALRFWSWIYMISTLVFSYFLGGFICTRSEAVESPSSGAIHALVSWAVATMFIAVAGAIATIGFRVLLVGFATNTANWLAIGIVGLGGFFSAFAGTLGKFSKHRLVAAHGTEEKEKKAA